VRPISQAVLSTSCDGTAIVRVAQRCRMPLSVPLSHLCGPPRLTDHEAD
jgi:hypothetical protein